MSPLGYMWSPDSTSGKQYVQRNIFGDGEVPPYKVPLHRANTRTMRGAETSPRIVSMAEQPCVKSLSNNSGDRICSHSPCGTTHPEVLGVSKPPLGEITNTADSDLSSSSVIPPAVPHGTNKNSQTVPRIKHCKARHQRQSTHLTALQEVNIADNGVMAEEESGAQRGSGCNKSAEERCHAPVTPTNAEEWCLHVRSANVQVTLVTVSEKSRIWSCTRDQVPIDYHPHDRPSKSVAGRAGMLADSKADLEMIQRGKRSLHRPPSLQDCVGPTSLEYGECCLIVRRDKKSTVAVLQGRAMPKLTHREIRVLIDHQLQVLQNTHCSLLPSSQRLSCRMVN